MLSSTAFGIFFISLSWENPPRSPVFVALGKYALGDLLARWAPAVFLFPVIELFFYRRLVRREGFAVGIDSGLAVIYFLNVGMLVALQLFNP